MNIEVIRSIFSNYLDSYCWALTRGKVPYNFIKDHPLQWKRPDSLYQFSTAEHLFNERFFPNNDGIGIFLGIDDIACWDLDHCLYNGRAKNESVADILSRCGSYAEISQSGAGIHIFYMVDNTSGVSPEGFKTITPVCDGEFYTKDRFIKLTGNTWLNSPLQYLPPNKMEYLRKKYGEKILPIEPKNNFSPQSDIPLVDHLTEVNIPFIEIRFTRILEHHTKHGGVIEAIETECPNIGMHTQNREQNAVFYRCADGFIGGRCWHEHCSPQYLFLRKTSLTKLLFEKIRAEKDKIVLENLKDVGVVL